MTPAPQENLENGFRQEDVDAILANGLANGASKVWKSGGLTSIFSTPAKPSYASHPRCRGGAVPSSESSWIRLD